MKIRRLDTRSEIYEKDNYTFASDPVVENEEELDFTPDEYDAEEGLTPAKLAAKYIRENSGAIEASCSQYFSGTWYSSNDTDIQSGDMLETSWHIIEATESERRELYALLNR